MVKRLLFGLIFIAFALLKLGDMLDLFHWDWLWRQPWTEFVGPFALLCLGIDILMGGFKHRHDSWLQRPVPPVEEGKRIVCATKYGGDEYVYHGETFRGAKLDASFGGIRLDLREAVIKEDEEIDIHTFFGGVEILVPRAVDVTVRSHSLIGGVGNEASSCADKDAPCLHIIASNFIGGVSIKN